MDDLNMKTNATPRDDSAASGPNGTLGPDAEWSALRYVLGEMTAAEADAFEQTLASDPQACEQVAAATHLTSAVYNVLAAEEPIYSVLASDDRNAVLAAELSGQAPNGVRMSQSARATPVVVPARSVRGIPVRTGQVRSGQVRRGQWAIVGLAAAVCVVVAGGLSWLSAPNTPQDATALDRADGAGSLVAIWTEQSAEAAEESPTTGAVAGEHANADETVSSAVSVADADDLNGTDEDEVLIADDDYNVPGWMIAAVDNSHSFTPGNPSMDVQEN
jgi:hypothetical protein